MKIVIFVSIGLASFLSGAILGIVCPISRKKNTPNFSKRLLKRKGKVIGEFRSFLSYDGTPQP